MQTTLVVIFILGTVVGTFMYPFTITLFLWVKIKVMRYLGLRQIYKSLNNRSSEIK